MEKIEKEFQKREQWITQFTIGGKKYGGEICNISHIVFIWTHYATEDKANEIANGFRGFWHAEG